MKKSKRWLSLLLAALMLLTTFAGTGISALAGYEEYDLDAGKWVTSKGKNYYYGYDGTKAVSDSVRIDDKVYVFDSKGRQITKKGWCTVSREEQGWDDEESFTVTNWYYIKADGTAQTGWLKLKKSWYYFDDYSAEMATGSYNIDGVPYLFNDSGKLIQKAGWRTIFNEDWNYESKYYLNADGSARTGWWKIGKKWLHFYDYTGEYEQFTKYQKIYFYDEEGNIVKKAGWHKYGEDDADEGISAEWVYTDKTGRCKIGWQTIGGKTYFFQTGYGYRLTGTQTIGGKTYQFTDKGVLRTKKGWRKADGESYYALKGGVLASGWQKINKKWYYFDPVYHYMYYGGSHIIDGKPYVFAQNGALVTKKGWYSIYYEEGDWTSWYYVTDGGVALTGWQTIGKKQYYFNKNYGYLYYDSGDRIDGKVYVFDKDGVLVKKKGWYSITYDYYGEENFTVWYYLNGDGTAKTGWQKIGKKYYYFSKDGGYMATGVKRIEGKNYYFTDKGVWKKLYGWKTVGDDTYYFGKDGCAVNGTKKIAGTWYRFYTDGTLIEDDD